MLAVKSCAYSHRLPPSTVATKLILASHYSRMIQACSFLDVVVAAASTETLDCDDSEVLEIPLKNVSVIRDPCDCRSDSESIAEVQDSS
jgi:hypothetical protein